MIGPTNANARYVKAISSSTNDHVVTFNGTGGNSIKDSGKTIGVSIPAPDTSTDVGMSFVVQSDGSLSYGVPPGNYVTLDTQQDNISGQKTFTTPVIMSGGHDNSYFMVKNSRFNGSGFDSQNQSEGLLTLTNSDNTADPVVSLGIQQYSSSSPYFRALTVIMYKRDKTATPKYNWYPLIDDLGYVRSTTPALTQNDTIVATTAWARDTTTDNSTGLSKNGLVHNSGSETIGGSKTFTSAPNVKMSLPQFYLKHTTDDYTQTTSAVDTRYFLGFQDKNGADTFHLSEYVYNGGRAMSITQQNKVGGSTIRSCNLTLYAPGSSGGYATCTYRETPATNGELLVVGNGVTSSTAQTISGQKTFDSGSATTNILVNTSQYGYITFKNSGYTKGTSSNSGECAIRFNDSTNSTTGWLANTHSTAFDSVTTLSAYGKNISDSSVVDARITVRAIHDGTKYATAPYRTYDASNDTDVVTIGTLNTAMTVAGAKTFTAQPYITTNAEWKMAWKDTRFDVTNSSHTSVWNTVGFRDTNNKRIAQMSAYAYNTLRGIRFYVFDNADSGNSELNFYKDFGSSTAWVVGPSPPPTTKAYRNITISTSDPSGGSDGDIWIKY